MKDMVQVLKELERQRLLDPQPLKIDEPDPTKAEGAKPANPR
jgi:hypothetical protein